MATNARKEAKKKLKEEKKRMREEEKRKKKEAKQRGKKGFVGHVISGPTDFSHDTHVGWDTDRGFEVRNIPPEWKRLFQAAGVKKSDLADPETRQILVNTVRQSIMMSRSPLGNGIPPAPPTGGSVPPPPPPPAPPAPPPVPGLASSGSSISSPRAAPRRRDPFAVGNKIKAIWSGDGQWYEAVIDSVREEAGVKYYSVTFTGYGDQEELAVDSLQAEETPGAGAASGAADLKSQLQAQASKLSAPDLADISREEETTIVDSVQKALAARRANMCFSVYGHDAVDDEEWSDDESWLDF